jgi:glyoxylase-like metal-dependent hydrolase (beta-lactamase superfamily II)
MITHAHPDHVGGTLDGEGKLVYANAHYYIWKDEWDFWFSELTEAKTPERFVACARTNLEPLQDRVTLVDRESNVVPGIGVIPAPGHTPGHIVASISSGDERLLYIGDTVLYPLHLEHPDWLPIYDIIPEKAEVSKHRIFDMAAQEKAWVIGQHFPPFPSLGHVVKKGAGWEWQPIEMME